ncbi:biliverdin-producing heme oxygenase [Sphingomonas sp. MMS24-JH45]
MTIDEEVMATGVAMHCAVAERSWSRASTDRLSASALLREATRPAHDGVDAAYGRFDLGVREDYAAFLTAHARALPAAEARMAMLPFAATLPPRAVAGGGPRRAGRRAARSAGAADGRRGRGVGDALVVEGSRLGGAMLARGVPAGWPAGYLGAVHAPGAWRAIRAAIDAAGADRDAAWRGAMVAGALETFDLYARAAG